MRENQAVQGKGALVILLLLPVFINHVFSQSEVSAVSPRLVQRTNLDDMAGLHTIMGNFSQLQNWTGDPCHANNIAWDWLGCNADNPPRVTSLNLSGYGLEGSIPDFHQMQALEIIKMDRNNLTGKIPDFLGNLPNLKLLNLSYNNLDNEVPSSLNNSITIHDSANDQSYSTNYSDSDENKTDPLDALWSLVGLVIICVGIWWCCCRTPVVVVQPQHNPGPVIEVEEVEVVSHTQMGHHVGQPEVASHTVVGQPVMGQPVHAPVTMVGHVEHTTITIG